MLLNLYLNFVYFITTTFLSLFSDADLGLITNITSAATTASSYISAVDSFTPVGTIISIVGLWLVIELIMITIKIINWVIRKIPTIS
jgi:hypothetical protein